MAFETQDFSSRRYANLVRYQYTLLDPRPEARLAPDSAFSFRDYGYYPVFLEGIRFKRRTDRHWKWKAQWWLWRRGS